MALTQESEDYKFIRHLMWRYRVPKWEIENILDEYRSLQNMDRIEKDIYIVSFCASKRRP